MNRLTIFLVTVSLFLAAGRPCGAGQKEEPARATLGLGPWSERVLTGDHAGYTHRTREAAFDLGPVRYAIRYCACADPQDENRAIPVEGYIGMPAPSSENWYHSGFLFIALNGEDVGNTRLSSMTAVESGQRAMADLVWRHRLAAVRARFVGLPGEDKLLLEIAIEPQEEITSITVRARCYPSFFTSWHHRDGARRVKTPSRLVPQGENVELPAQGNEWLLYYDEVFDVARGEGVGPCAMMISSDEATSVRVQPGDYAVDTEVTYKPDVRRLHLAFWDLAGRTNADALQALPAAAEKARAQFVRRTFTPEAVLQFGPEEARREITTALQSEAVRTQLGERAKEFLAALDRMAPAFDPDAAIPAVQAEEQFLTWREQYESFRWEMKLVELLDF